MTAPSQAAYVVSSPTSPNSSFHNSQTEAGQATRKLPNSNSRETERDAYVRTGGILEKSDAGKIERSTTNRTPPLAKPSKIASNRLNRAYKILMRTNPEYGGKLYLGRLTFPPEATDLRELWMIYLKPNVSATTTNTDFVKGTDKPLFVIGYNKDDSVYIERHFPSDAATKAFEAARGRDGRLHGVTAQGLKAGEDGRIYGYLQGESGEPGELVFIISADGSRIELQPAPKAIRAWQTLQAQHKRLTNRPTANRGIEVLSTSNLPGLKDGLLATIKPDGTVLVHPEGKPDEPYLTAAAIASIIPLTEGLKNGEYTFRSDFEGGGSVSSTKDPRDLVAKVDATGKLITYASLAAETTFKRLNSLQNSDIKGGNAHLLNYKHARTRSIGPDRSIILEVREEDSWGGWNPFKPDLQVHRFIISSDGRVEYKGVSSYH